jgi:hypothetical protein
MCTEAWLGLEAAVGNPTNWMFAWSLVPVSILPIRADPHTVETEKVMMVELVWLGELSLARRAETKLF